MTTIITDGKSMAADRMLEWCGKTWDGKKIFRIKKVIVGISGNMPLGRRVIEWYKNGCDIEKLPDIKEINFMEISKEKGIRLLCKDGFYQVKQKFVAIGCGEDYAESAAHFGKTLEESIEFAAEHDLFTGMGVDILHLEEEKITRTIKKSKTKKSNITQAQARKAVREVFKRKSKEKKDALKKR